MSSARLIKHWRADGGNVGVTFALALIPIIFAVGGAVEFASASGTQTHLQDALDSAVLAGAAKLSTSREAAISEATSTFAANGIVLAGLTPSFDEKDGIVTGTVKAKTETILLKAVGVPNLPLNASSAATQNPSQGGMELAVVVDVSGSMTGSIPSLRSSITELLKTIYKDKQQLEDTYISIVPFSGRVNVTNYGGKWFAAGQIPATDAFKKVDEWGVVTYGDSRCKISSYTSSYPRLCAARRTGDRQWDDSLPSAEPFKLFTGGAEVCPVPRAQGLTQSRPILQQIASNLCAGHGTSTQEGMAWGWRAVSPRWRGMWGDPRLPLDAADSPGKIVIIMTDGQNHPSQAGDPLTVAQADAELLKTCEAMKREGITIYAITYGMGGSLSTLYRKCTSKPENEIAAESGAALMAAFVDIGGRIGRGDGRVRLVR